MIRLLLFIVFCISVSGTSAQNFDANSPPNTFQSPANPYYWENRPPHPGYWQQDVYYRIKANIDERTDIIEGTETLTYWNNSPDTLHHVFFHLYQNAFQPGSYYHKLQEANNVEPNYNKYEQQGLGTVISRFESNGKTLQTELDNTILRVWLNEPLAPGGNITFDIDFKTYYGGGSVRRRMKKFNVNGHKHFDGVHWYPRISVYDRKFGWTTDQHLGKEFYGDFGTFEVELTFANHYVVEATGTLQNRSEVMPDSLRQKLDIKNFADKIMGSPASEIIVPDGTRKTWKYYAENVHDFAFTADPTYRIGEVEWNGIKCISLAQETNAAGWQNAAEYTAKLIEVYSTDIGMYAWPKIIVADARDGMEYNMITLNGGSDPGYRDLLAHEVAHMWFYGMVANNETYRASLDEGFSQFIDSWAMEKIDGKYVVANESPSAYIRNYYRPRTVRYDEVYYGYLATAMRQNELPLATHSDNFKSALHHGGGYGMVYYKPAVMLYNLQYVLGDELFLKAMQNYFDQWKFCHPYFEDVRNSFIHFTGVDLNWFFDQWLETTKTIDYAIAGVKRRKDNNYEIKFKRKGEMQMPIDFTVYTKDGKDYNYHIPNNWFVKETPATVLPRWIGWGKLNKEYTATVNIDGAIDKVVIDTTQRLADIDMRNNETGFTARLFFDSQVSNWPEWTFYEMKARPDIWWNAYDGIKAGFHLNGNYMRYRDLLHLSVWVNTGLAQKQFDGPVRVNEFDEFSFNFRYKENIDRFVKDAAVNVALKRLDGMYGAEIGGNKYLDGRKYNFFGSVKTMLRERSTQKIYLLYPNEWIIDNFNTTINLGVEDNYQYRRGTGKLTLQAKTSAFSSAYDYTFLSLEALNRNNLGKFRFNTRTFFQFGYGTLLAPESALFLYGANPEEMMENKYVRARGFVPDEWVLGFGPETNHFHHGGGLNLRGYSGYLAPEINEDGQLIFTYRGSSGAAFNAELEFDRFFPIRPRFTRQWLQINTYLFGDVGTINTSRADEDLRLADVRADAGVGAALTIKKWGPLQTVKPLTVRFDMPLLLNRPPAGEEFFQFRWVVGVNRA
ncbi:MAG: M1 family aminopeptidase, partial [Bacteroidia bacterium]